MDFYFLKAHRERIANTINEFVQIGGKSVANEALKKP